MRGDVVEMIVCPQGKIVISEDGEDMIRSCPIQDVPGAGLPRLCRRYL